MARNPKVTRRTRARGLTNHLKKFRTDEGIKRASLARKAVVSDRTTQRIESGHESTPETLHRLLNALNALRAKRASEYAFEEVFPNH